MKATRPGVLFLLTSSLFLTTACAERQLKVGAYKAGVVVEARAASADEAKRAAVAGLFDLFLSSESLARERAQLDEKILAHSGDFVLRTKDVSSKGSKDVFLRVQVSAEKLGHALDALGLVKPEGVAGRPRLVVSVRESGLGAGDLVGTASDSLRRTLVERGYLVVDLSDRALAEPRKTEDESEAVARAKTLKADVVITGTARSEPLEDARLEGYHPYQASLALKSSLVQTGEVFSEFSTQTSALDVEAPGAASRALTDAGGVAAARLREALSGHFFERTEMSVLFVGLGGLDRARRLVFDLRGEPFVSAAALDSILDEDVKVRVFVERLSADELAAALMRMNRYAFNVRAVESDYHYVELEGAAHAL